MLIVAGSRGMTGAAALAGLGALRGGAGLVSVATPGSVQPVVAGIEPSYLTLDLPENKRGRLGSGAASIVLEYAAGMDAVAIGPGLGNSSGVESSVAEVYRTLPQPLVVDADGLNALAKANTELGQHAGPRILTPHPGEFSRLCGISIVQIQARRDELAVQFAARHKVVLVLKGPGTVVTDGAQTTINPTGNSGMATGGSGDVLTGLIAALLAQGMSPIDASQLGVWMHGRAGDLAVRDLSEPGLIASDLPRYLGAVWRELASTAG